MASFSLNQDLLNRVVNVTLDAGRAVMAVYETDFGSTEKADASPLTQADLASHEQIMQGLREIDPEIPVLSEESKAQTFEERSGWTRFWLVDPLDGTKEFIKRNGEFTVNIALIEDGRPVLGVVHAPVLKTTYLAAEGLGAFKDENVGRRQIQAEAYQDGTLRVVASRSHAGPETEALIDTLRAKYGDVDLVSKGSSLKLCMVSDGEAHLYPRLGPTMEWDVAAADAVVRGAGGSVVDTQGNPLRYNKENLLNPFFIVAGPGKPLLEYPIA